MKKPLSKFFQHLIRHPGYFLFGDILRAVAPFLRFPVFQPDHTSRGVRRAMPFERSHSDLGLELRHMMVRTNEPRGALK